MNILISNDDGFESIGTLLLAQNLEREGHTVFLALPQNNCSGNSSKVRINKKIRYILKSERFMVIVGTPIECLLVGLDFWKCRGIEMDIIIAGINQGMNLGLSRRYSGTLAIIYEALNQGYPALSISSQIPISELSAQYIKEVITDVTQKYLSMWKQNHTFGINVNIFSKNEPICYCEEESVINATEKLLSAIKEDECTYRIGINKNLEPINTNGGTVIIGYVTKNELNCEAELLECSKVL